MLRLEEIGILPPTEVTLSSDDIHVWVASLDQPAGRVRWLAHLLSADERMRAKRLSFDRQRTHFIVGRGVLRAILANYVGTEPSQLQFCYGLHRKPALVDVCSGRALRFNLSHSDGLALYAVTHDREIGVDLERVRPVADFEQIARRYFTSGEYAVLCALDAAKQHEAFFNCWTRKEAYLKAIGTGLIQSLDSVEVSLAPGEPARLLGVRETRAETEGWSIHELAPAFGYVAALVVKGQGRRVTCRQWWA